MNQPEQLQDAWGTEETSQARQSSLVQAGVIELPVKKRDIYDKIRVGIYVAGLLMCLALAGVGIASLYNTKQQHDAVTEIKSLVEGKNAKITSPLLVAEAHRTLGLLHLRSDDRKRATKARYAFQAAQSFAKVNSPDKDINEQMFLIDLALSQIELGGSESEFIDGSKIKWDLAREEIAATLNKITSPEAQVLALREGGSRLFARDEKERAIGLTSTASAKDGKGKRPIAYRQQIALIYARGDQDAMKGLPPPPDLAGKTLKDAHARIGYAEGYARKGVYEKAKDLVQFPGPAPDRLEASLGVAAVALLKSNQKEAADFVKEALSIIKEKDAKPTPWQVLHLAKLAARTGNADAVKDLVKNLPNPFRLRADLEIFLAGCDNAHDPLEGDKLLDLENNDKEAKKDDTPGITLAFAWTALARKNASLGAGRGANRKTFDSRMGIAAISASPELLRPMTDIGTYQGSMK